MLLESIAVFALLLAFVQLCNGYGAFIAPDPPLVRAASLIFLSAMAVAFIFASFGALRAAVAGGVPLSRIALIALYLNCTPALCFVVDYGPTSDDTECGVFLIQMTLALGGVAYTCRILRLAAAKEPSSLSKEAPDLGDR